MRPEESLRSGDVRGTLAQLQEQVRARPADAKLRIFLFQVLSVTGDWGRALNQLEVSGELDASALAMMQTYRVALGSEPFRREVFAGGRTPLVFGQPEPWVALVFEALRLHGAGRVSDAEELRARAFDEAPAIGGTIHVRAESGSNGSEPVDEHPFEWIADADPRLGPMLEVVVNNRYYWIPFARIRRIVLEAPADLRDLVWTPARFTWANGGESVGLIPTRYAGSEQSPDDAIRLARRTEWVAAGGDTYTGLGQRLLVTDAAEYALLDVREIHLDAPPSGDQKDEPRNG